MRCFFVLEVVFLFGFSGVRFGWRVPRIKPRKALFTASEFGKALATSGSRITIFDDSVSRFVYFPRTSSPKSERLYSGRPQSLASDLTFFIDSDFARGCSSSAD